MSDVLLINVTGDETRVALVEDGVLAEFYVERKRDRGIVGNIYKGRVVRVLPGMQAAFVDIGTDRSAFLYVSEVLSEHFNFALEDDGETTLLDEQDGRPRTEPTTRKARASRRIEELIKEGQEILVQVAKEPIGTKGARLTCHITLPGRFLVFMPTVNHIGISRRISADRERKRLRSLVDEMRPEGSGFIVRTAAANEPSEHLRQDMRVLIEAWQDVLAKRDTRRAPLLLHADFGLVLKATRDLVSTKIDRIVVDSTELYERIPDFVRRCMPGFYCSVELYQRPTPIFEAFGIEHELNRALVRKVWLRSGGYLVIDQTEALTSIDVNTGKYVGKTSLEETITKINVEAVEEVVYQLRLRNIGGLIIIDFIDMEGRENREKVYQALAKALERDKARTNLLKISEFGLVEMTRKRVQESLVQQLCEPCPHCDGQGRIKADSTIAHEVLRNLRRTAHSAKGHRMDVHAHASILDYLKRREQTELGAIEDEFKVEIKLRRTNDPKKEGFRVSIDETANAKPKQRNSRRNTSRSKKAPQQLSSEAQDATPEETAASQAAAPEAPPQAGSAPPSEELAPMATQVDSGPAEPAPDHHEAAAG